MWNDVHSESWPMTPDESRYGYTPTYLQSPVIAQPYGVPVGGMAGRRFRGLSQRERRRMRKMRRRARRAERQGKREARLAMKRQGRPVPHFQSTGIERGDGYLMEGMRGGSLNSGGCLTVAELTELSAILEEKRQFTSLTSAQTRRLAELNAKQAACAATAGTPSKSSASASTARASAPASPAVPVWREAGAEVVPQGRDGQTYFRSLGFSSGDARRLAEHARAYPNQRGERRQMMDRFGAPMERRMNQQASGGRGVDLGGVARGVGDLFGGLFGRREQAQTFDFGGGDVVAAAPAPSGMSPILIAGLAAAGLGAVFLLTQD